MIECRGITKTYRTAHHTTHVLKDATFSVAKGERVALWGRSGSGKSTMMHLLGLLDRPTSGYFALKGQDTAGIAENELPVWRNQVVGFVFQSFYLLPALSVLENVSLPLLYRGVAMDEAVEQARSMLDELSMLDWQEAFPIHLSGGQQQRVAIARALVGSPDVLLADEPTGALDQAHGEQVMHLIDRMTEKLGMSVVLVTHDSKAAKWADRILTVEGGCIGE